MIEKSFLPADKTITGAEQVAEIADECGRLVSTIQEIFFSSEECFDDETAAKVSEATSTLQAIFDQIKAEAQNLNN